MNEDIQRAKQKIRPVVSKVASVANLTHGRAIAGELGAESVLQVQRYADLAVARRVISVMPASAATTAKNSAITSHQPAISLYPARA